MSKKYLSLGLVAGMLIGGVTLSGLSVSAHPGGGQELEDLGVDKAELREARKNGESMEEFLESKGITMEQLDAQREQNFRERLLKEGFSEDEINQRVEEMELMR